MMSARIEGLYSQRHSLEPSLRWFALADGLAYANAFGHWLTPGPGKFAVFTGTQDEPLAHAGPWLLEMGAELNPHAERFDALEAFHGVSWIFAPQTIEGLGQLLQLHLDVEGPEGQRAMLRFWDPRVLYTLMSALDVAQKQKFFGLIDQWHFTYMGEHFWVGRGECA